MHMTKVSPPHDYSCPVCNGVLHSIGLRYTISELFEMWKPITFSAEIVEEHQRQSTCTQMYSCSRCGLDIFLPQIIGTHGFYRELQANPEAAYYEDDKWDFNEALKDAAGCKAIIELGCGPGSFLSKAQHLVPEVYGTESNELALQSAQAKGLKVLSLDDNLKSQKGCFDAAFTFHVLEHVADPVDFFSSMCSLVRPGGKIGISVPNQDGPIQYINPCIMNMPPHHATRWRLKTFQAMAQRFGLSIDRTAYEPLLLQNHSYYSHFWLNQRFPGNSPGIVHLRSILSKIMHGIFGNLMKSGRKYLPLLRGQAIYILMSKPRA